MEQSTGPQRPTLEHLRHVAAHFPIIDGHAHNLILPKFADALPFESITTEAQGRALRDTFKSLPHLRAARQLRQLYECGEDADWEDILEQRIEWLRSDPQRLHQRCFEGIHAVLVDDGVPEQQKVYPFDANDEYFQAPSKRLVRIETVAERLMERIVQDATEDDLGKAKFLPDTWVEFTDEFERLIQQAVKDPEVAGFKTVISYRTGLDIEPEYEEAARLVGHPFERYVKACIRKRTYRIERKSLNDYLVLRTLEILSEKLPNSDALSKPLLLHTGLGDNDIDLRKANPAYLQQLIEAYPSVPFVLLNSAYPYTREAGYLATVYRHVYLDLGEVSPMLSRDGQLTILRQALELTPGSKLLYSSSGHWFPETYYLASIQFREVWVDLLSELVQKGDLTVFQAIGLTKDLLFNNANMLYNLRYQATFDESSAQEAPKQLTYNTRPTTTSPQQSPGMPPPIPPAGTTIHPTTTAPVEPRSGSPYSSAPAPTFPPPPTAPHVYETSLFDAFMKQHPDTRFVYVQWLDYSSATCTRIVPIKEFSRMIREGDRIAVSQDTAGADNHTQAQMYIEPDLRSLRLSHQDELRAASVLSYWRSHSGAPLPTCPRTVLETLVNTLQYTHATSLLVGYEIRVAVTDPSSSTSTFLSDLLLALDKSDIPISHISPSTLTLTLTPQPPLPATDTLLQTTQLLAQLAPPHTLHIPRVSLTLHPPNAFFAAGITAHLPAVCAFTMHVSEDVPMRVVDQGTAHLYFLSARANAYLALAAVLAAGVLGIVAGGGRDGGEGRVPGSVGEAVGALEGDEGLRGVLGGEVVGRWVRVMGRGGGEGV